MTGGWQAIERRTEERSAAERRFIEKEKSMEWMAFDGQYLG